MSYFDIALNPKKMKDVTTIFRGISDILELQPDTFLGRGISGAVAAPQFAAAFENSHVMISRKESDCSHGGRDCLTYDSDNEVNNIIIVDDFICSGTTIKKILNQLSSQRSSKANVKAVFLYNCGHSGSVCPDDYRCSSDFNELLFFGVNYNKKEVYSYNQDRLTEQQLIRIKAFVNNICYTYNES